MKKNTIDGGAANVPRHVAIIMDGNGRWAKKRLMPRSFGHKKGMERMMGLIEHALNCGVEYVTVYALSTENLKRPQAELEGLFNLIREHFAPSFLRICENGIRLKVLGDTSLLPEDIQEIIFKAEQKTENFRGRAICVALCYGARQEILQAVNRAIERGETLTEESFSALLYTGGMPDPDLIIRTGKEKRISNFLLYQAAYAEFYFSDKMFPEFSDKDLDEAFMDFSTRKRRFGKTDEQCEEKHE